MPDFSADRKMKRDVEDQLTRALIKLKKMKEDKKLRRWEIRDQREHIYRLKARVRQLSYIK